MSAVASLSAVPAIIEAGTTVRFTVGDSDYPATAWTMAFVLNNGVAAATSIAGTANGTSFDVVIPSSTTLTPGTYQWAQYFTAISPTTEKARGDTGALEVIANLATTATPSNAQAMVTLLETVLQTFAATTTTSVSFNGQSFSRASINEYQANLVFWKARVIAENQKQAFLRGENVGGGIRTVFVSAGGSYPNDYCA